MPTCCFLWLFFDRCPFQEKRGEKNVHICSLFYETAWHGIPGPFGKTDKSVSYKICALLTISVESSKMLQKIVFGTLEKNWVFGIETFNIFMFEFSWNFRLISSAFDLGVNLINWVILLNVCSFYSNVFEQNVKRGRKKNRLKVSTKRSKHNFLPFLHFLFIYWHTNRLCSQLKISHCLKPC